MRGAPAWLPALLLAASCQGEPGAERVLRRYLELLHRGQVAEAYRLTTAAFQEQCDLACFRQMASQRRDDLGGALKQTRAGQVKTELRAEVPGPPPVTLVQRDAGRRGAAWEISGDPLDFYPQGTAEQALRSFVRAIEARRYGVALRFVPPRLRQQVSEARLRERWEGERRAELLKQLEAVKRHLAEPLISDGQEARLPVGEQKEARLVLEDGRWHVLQLQ